jgi:hypothetical protein
MLLGHYAVGFAGRGTWREPRARPSLGTWFLAVQWLDLVWPLFVLAGWERLGISSRASPFLHLDFISYPWSHSLLAAVLWGVAFAAVYRWRTGDAATAPWLAAAVVSHWVLDWLTHVPDLPLYPGSVRVGLGLWQSPAATVAVEGVLFLVAVIAYARRTEAVDGVGRWAFVSLVAFLAIVYVASLVGPPPPDANTVAASALLLWLLIPWAYWIDRHRTPAGAR